MRAGTCYLLIPGNCIDEQRYPLFMNLAVLNELMEFAATIGILSSG